MPVCVPIAPSNGVRFGPSREATSRRLTSKHPDFDRRDTGPRARLASVPA
jgi:hypothetical protein